MKNQETMKSKLITPKITQETCCAIIDQIKPIVEGHEFVLLVEDSGKVHTFVGGSKEVAVEMMEDSLARFQETAICVGQAKN